MSTEELKITSVQEWKAASTPKVEGSAIRLPSGRVARVRIPGIEDFFRAGLIPNTLLPLVKAAMDTAKGGKSDQVKKDLGADMLADPEMVVSAMEMTDAIAVYCFMEPLVYPVMVPDPDTGELTFLGPDDRNPERLYVDEVDLQDKMFVFQAAAGGTKDVERFREGPVEHVAAVPTRKSVAKATKRTGRAGPKKS